MNNENEFNLGAALEDLEKRVSQEQKKVTNVTEVTFDLEKILNPTEYPLDVFPSDFKKFIEEVSQVYDVDVSVTGTTLLTIVSAALGNTLRVSPKKGYIVPPFIWAVIMSPSGTGKSHIMKSLMHYIEQLQSVEKNRHDEAMRLYELDMEKSDQKPKPPILRHYFISDITVESLVSVFAQNPRGVVSYQDELSKMILGLNQYKGRNGNDLQHYIELFNSGSWKIDRKSTGCTFVRNTGMGIIGGIQPEVVPQIFTDESFQNGFIYRFVFTAPPIRPLKFNRETIKDFSLWGNFISFCYYVPLDVDDSGFVRSRILTLSDNALDVWESFYNRWGQLAEILPANVRGFIPKYYLYSLKFAGILHAFECFTNARATIAESDKISADTIRKAITLTEYYLGQVCKLLKSYEKDSQINNVHKRIIQAIYYLQAEFKNGKLELSKILQKYNEGLIEQAHLTPKSLGHILSDEIELTVRKSNGNLTFLFWDVEKLQKLFNTMVTSVTKVTPPVTEGAEVTVNSQENFQSCDNTDTFELNSGLINQEKEDVKFQVSKLEV